MIKFLELHKINARFESEFQRVFNKFLNSGHYVLGKEVESFEKSFSDYCGTTYGIGVSNGLDALTLIFKALIFLGKLKEGDEVLVPANTYIASILAVINADLTPVFVEPDVSTFNISPQEMEKKITAKTKAVLVVHLYGQLADMNAINLISKKNNILIIEDAAQAHGAEDDLGKRAGSFGIAAGFSFYPTKNLGALGEAGCITTNNLEMAEILLKLRNYGSLKRYHNELMGYNNRLDEIQAAFLNVKLPFLESANQRRKIIAEKYLLNINNEKVVLPACSGREDHVFHLFTILVEDRSKFMEYMIQNDVETAIYYPTAPHKQPALSAYKDLELPITIDLHKKVVSLPLNTALTDNEIDKIIKVVNAY